MPKENINTNYPYAKDIYLSGYRDAIMEVKYILNHHVSNDGHIASDLTGFINNPIDILLDQTEMYFEKKDLEKA